jgi:hypothetical protein
VYGFNRNGCGANDRNPQFPKVSRPAAQYEASTEAVYEVALAAGLAQVNGDSNDGECVTGACPIW